MRVILIVLAFVACGHPPTPVSPAPSPSPAPAPAQIVIAPTPAAAAATRTVEVSETHFGITVVDPYRWMEGTRNPELVAWLTAQGKRARAWLDRIPGRDALLVRIAELDKGTGIPTSAQLAGGRLFYEYTAPGEQLAKLMVREHGKDRVLIDPAALGKNGQHASLNNYAASFDGTKVAYNIALGGGEVSTIKVMTVATGKDLPDAVDHVWGEFAASWLADGSGFYYTQQAPPKDGVDPWFDMQARLHVLGKPVTADRVVFGTTVPGAFALTPAELPSVWTAPGSTWSFATAGGAHSESRLAAVPTAALDRSGTGKTAWKPVADYADGVNGTIPHGDRLYLLSYQGASNRKIISVPLAHPELASARVDIAEDPQQVIVSWADARDALYIAKHWNGSSHLYRWPWKGTPTEIALPFPGWIDELVTDQFRDGITISEEGWTRPPAYYAYTARSGQLAAIGLAAVTNADYTPIVADEVMATSRDGTEVPLSILHRKDAVASGTSPAIVYGYAGYGTLERPTFSPTRLAWLERGGVIADCHARGGGDRGHQWQLDGTHEHKLNGVHDFEACAQYLADHKISSAAHTFAQGGSMGGILVGRALTDRPELFAAVNIAVGMVDPVRILAADNGANQLSELGDPATEVGFKGIYAMSPYAHVTAQAYPATIFTVGLNDKRVAPWMTSKMAARMQALTSSDRPIVVRVEGDAGHGIGSTRDQKDTERADVWSFFLAASGDPAFTIH